MKKSKAITISLPNPCNEKWHLMNYTEKGKFCSACKKEVIDFTNMTDSEIFKIIQENNFKICGKFEPNQLNRKIYTKSKAYTFKYKKIAASIIAILTFKFSYAQSSTKSIIDTTTSPNTKRNIQNDSLKEYIISGKITSDDGILLLIESPTIQIGNKTFDLKLDTSGKYRIVISENNIKEYTIITFNHSILKREVRSIHKSSFPVELNVFMSNPTGPGLMGVPIFDENGNIPNR